MVYAMPFIPLPSGDNRAFNLPMGWLAYEQTPARGPGRGKAQKLDIWEFMVRKRLR